MLLVTCLLAFYLAWNLGANDVANSMGTSVGSKAVSLKNALIIAAVLEFTGAVLFGREVSETLASRVFNPIRFVQTPQTLLIGMVAVLVACGLWLHLATTFGLPASSSHAVVGALAGFAWKAGGPVAVDWLSIGWISLIWVVTPLISGAIAALFYSLLRVWVLQQANPLAQLQEWIPWLSTALTGVVGGIVLPPLFQTELAADLPVPPHTLALMISAIATLGLTLFAWRNLESHFMARTALATPSSGYSPLERLMARFQLFSAGCVAFAHGSNDVGNAIAPVAVVLGLLDQGRIAGANFAVPVWLLGLGGVGIVAGLATGGQKVIATVGEGIIPLQPSSGFCAELATAATVLLASRLGLPVSTSHALVGAVIGIGLVQSWRSVRLQTLTSIGLVWVVTIPIAALLSAIVFFLGLQVTGPFLTSL